MININDKEVVLFVFNSRSSGIQTFLVPKDIAEFYNLASYDGEEISEGEPFLKHISDYDVSNIVASNYN